MSKSGRNNKIWTVVDILLDYIIWLGATNVIHMMEILEHMSPISNILVFSCTILLS